MAARDTPNVEVHGSSPWSGDFFFAHFAAQSKKPIETMLIGVRTISTEKNWKCNDHERNQKK